MAVRRIANPGKAVSSRWAETEGKERSAGLLRLSRLVTGAVTRFSRAYGQFMFNRTARKVADTAPLQTRPSNLVFLSQVCHRDVVPYLLAIKSLYRAIGEGDVVALDDGSLTSLDRRMLERHIPGLQIVHIKTVDVGRFPRGGTWERLIKIVELSATHYVIQADADTLVSGPIPEVLNCWKNNVSFLLGTEMGQAIEPAAVFAATARDWISNRFRADELKISTLAEAALADIPTAWNGKYVHASSGFAGFARSSVSVSDLALLSDWMYERFGKQWEDWGSEQISSNYLLANAANAVVLPFQRYACYEPPMSVGDRPFLHFIGSYRFMHGLYRKRVKQLLQQWE